MKKLFVVVAALIATSAFADHNPYDYPGGPLEAFGCSYSTLGQVCFSGDFFGQTLNDRPVQANVRAELISNTRDTINGSVDTIVRLTLTKITDPTNFYNADASVAVQVTAYICSYHRTCNWSTQTASVTMSRTYGQRYFENSPSFDFHIHGSSGSEDTATLTSVDVWLPRQQYPIQVKFANY